MVPIKCDSRNKSPAPAAILLIVACVAVYFNQHRFVAFSRGFVPLDFTHSLFHPGRRTLRMLVSCGIAFFMHGGIAHLLSNMWYLWIFGSAVEQRLGFGRFFLLYILCGAVSMLSQAFYSPLSPIPIVGASGAIAGIMGLQLAIAPLCRVLMWIPPFFFLHVPSFLFLLLWFYVQYASVGNASSSHVAWWAHIGGFVAGVALGIRVRVQESRAVGARRRK